MVNGRHEEGRCSIGVASNKAITENCPYHVTGLLLDAL